MWTSPNNTGDRSKTELDGRGIFHWALFWTDFFAFGRCIFDPAILNAFDGTVLYVCTVDLSTVQRRPKKKRRPRQPDVRPPESASSARRSAGAPGCEPATHGDFPHPRRQAGAGSAASLSVCLSIHVCLSVCLFVCLSACLSVRLSAAGGSGAGTTTRTSLVAAVAVAVPSPSPPPRRWLAPTLPASSAAKGCFRQLRPTRLLLLLLLLLRLRLQPASVPFRDSVKPPRPPPIHLPCITYIHLI